MKSNTGSETLKSIQPEAWELFRPEFNGICSKCSHRSTCEKPCYPVEQYLNFENQKPYEILDKGIIIVHPRSKREIRRSELNFNEDGKPTKPSEAVFSTVTDSPFASEKIDPAIKQTGIFVDRIFHRMSYADLAEKYNTIISGVAKMYVNAKSRLLKSIKAMDRADLALSNGQPLVEMPKGVKVFFLHSVFGLSISEIARFLDMNHTLVIRNIQTIRDRIITGQMDILTFTPNEKEAAHDRLETARAKRAKYDRKRRKSK